MTTQATPETDPTDPTDLPDGGRARAANAPIRGRVSPHRARVLLQGVVGSAEPIVTKAPATGDDLVRIPQANAADVAAAFERARAAQASWARLPPKQRAAIALRLHGLIMARQSDILDLIQLETGKARLHAYEEFLDGAGSTLYYARKAPRLLGTQRRGGAIPVFTQTRELHHPKGVVVTITPWNYPMALAADVIPALLAGNAVVHKPDNQTPLSSLWARSLAIEAGLPVALWQVVLGDPAVIGDALIDGADYVGFTGSTAVGRSIGERAATSLTGCSLELGGKNPMIVLADADIDATLTTAVRACFASAGQLCVAIERIYVQRSRYDEFVAAFGSKVRSLKLGAAMDFSVDVGSLGSQKQLDRVTRQVDDAVTAGAKVVAGGKARPDLGTYFFEPTVLVDVPVETEVYNAETFGPVVTITPFDTVDEAVRLANDTPYGLNASVFGKDGRRARAVAARVDAGTVNINEGYASAYASHDAPMGGRKLSGLGRRHGSEGLLKYTDAQTVSSQHVMGFDPGFGMGPEKHVKMFNATLRALKALRVR